MRFFHRRDPDLEDDLRKLETHLRETLQPVSIRPEFMRTLQARLIAGDIPPVKRRIPSRLSNILLVAGGILGSLMVIIAGIRGIISIIFVLGQVIQRLIKDAQRRREATPA